MGIVFSLVTKTLSATMIQKNNANVAIKKVCKAPRITEEQIDIGKSIVTMEYAYKTFPSILRIE